MELRLAPCQALRGLLGPFTFILEGGVLMSHEGLGPACLASLAMLGDGDPTPPQKERILCILHTSPQGLPPP